MRNNGVAGVIRKDNPTGSSLHTNRPLTNLSVAFMQAAEDFVADRVFPQVPVQNRSDKYVIYDHSSFIRNEMTKRARGTETAGGGWAVSDDDYYCDLWGIHKDIDDQDRDEADADIFNLDNDANEWLARKALINKEYEWSTNFFTTGVWDTDVTGVNDTPTSNSQLLQWGDTGSDPIQDIRYYKRLIKGKTGYFPNKLVLGRYVFDTLLDHPLIVDRVKYNGNNNNPAMTNKQILAQLLELDTIEVMDGIYEAAAEGLTSDIGFIGGDHALLLFAQPSPGRMKPSAGYTFPWKGLSNSRNGVRVKKFRMEKISSDRVELEHAYAQKAVATSLAVFFSGIVIAPPATLES